MLQFAEAAKPVEAPSPAETWLKFEQALGLQNAAAILAKLPADAASLERVNAFVENQNVADKAPVDFAVIGRVGAALNFLGARCQWDSTSSSLLQSVAKNRENPVILRDIALRSVIDTALTLNVPTGELTPHSKFRLRKPETRADAPDHVPGDIERRF